jgi:DNA-binding LacI/PurR family transcriptional regulator
MEVVDRMGFRPNTLARSLVQQRSNTLGVVIANLELYGPSRFLVGIEQQARQLGYKLFLSGQSPADVNLAVETLESFRGHLVDGIIWTDGTIAEIPSFWEQRLENLGIPAIYLGIQSDSGFPFVSIDNRLGARIATQHLLAQGYRHIGLVTGPVREWVSVQRRLGWQDALSEAGVTTQEYQVATGDWHAESGAKALICLREQFPQMDSIFVSNDQMALGVMKAASDCGLRVPRDLGIVGFDDVPDACCFQPSLTTMRQQLIEMGSVAVSELDRMIRARHSGDAMPEAKGIWFQPELVIRKSSIPSMP